MTVDPDDDDLLNSHSELLTDFGEDASFQYFPMWDVKLNVVNTYRCSIALLQKGKIHELASMLPPNCPDHVYERLNLLIAQKVILDIQEAAASEIVCAFNVPIRFSLLQNAKTRTAFTNMLKHLNHGEKQRLVIELTDIDKNTWSSRIIEVVGYLKPYCRATLIRVPQNFKDFADLKTGGVYAVGFHLPDLQGNEASKFKDLERLVIAAERVGLITYVGGVDNPSLAASAVGSGVRYIGGHAIGTPLDFPWGILPFELGNIYARHMTG